VALDARALGLSASNSLASWAAAYTPPESNERVPEFHMKTRLLIIGFLATLLAGCIVVPAHPYAYHPVPRVYVY
jgi:acyl-CoA synthetase (AMP-forming)/AMP-acid ligase II